MRPEIIHIGPPKLKENFSSLPLGALFEVPGKGGAFLKINHKEAFILESVNTPMAAEQYRTSPFNDETIVSSLKVRIEVIS